MCEAHPSSFAAAMISTLCLELSERFSGPGHVRPCSTAQAVVGRPAYAGERSRRRPQDGSTLRSGCLPLLGPSARGGKG